MFIYVCMYVRGKRLSRNLLEHFKLKERPRVRFFGKIQNWIIDLRSHGYFAPKETKNPKMDFCHDNGVNTFCTEHKNFRTNLLSVECILAKFISAYKIFHKNHTTKLFFFSLEHNVARNASESEECLQNDQCQLHS